jgi:hypothetical protein
LFCRYFIEKSHHEAQDVVPLLLKWKPEYFKNETIVIDFFQFLVDIKIIRHCVDPDKNFTKEYLFFKFGKDGIPNVFTH